MFSLLYQHQLLLKQSKCSFGEEKVCYLGHVMNANGVAMDTEKVQEILDWPRPRFVKALREFLGLARFYHKFIKDFGIIVAPLTSLLRKHSFVWTEATTVAFNKLKIYITTTLVLQSPDFSDMFVMEYDASRVGIGIVLHQNNHPVEFFNCKLVVKHHTLASYGQELIKLSQAIRH